MFILYLNTPLSKVIFLHPMQRNWYSIFQYIIPFLTIKLELDLRTNPVSSVNHASWAVTIHNPPH